MKRSWLNLIGLVIALIGVAVIVVTRQLDQQNATAPEDAFVDAPRDHSRPTKQSSSSVPAISQEVTRIANAELRGPFIGTATCASCHADKHKSYLETHHSRSLSLVDASHPEVAGSFYHEPSQTSFEVSVSKAGVIHRQSLRVPTSPTTTAEFPVSELPVKFVMGSGAFAKGYLLEDNGFLIQSPVTWYSKPSVYAMAPGYDVHHHLGTTRVIDDQCMFCHAGHVSLQAGNDEKLVVDELAINCERCHGPGREHATLFRTREKDAVIPDSKIVNPNRLDRMSAEAICAQCHLQGDIVVEAVGKSIWDFEPGTLLEKTRVTYKIDKAVRSESGKQKTFVDHFDQLWQSKCYQQSETLTCITCHDPHHVDSGRSSAVVQTDHCLKCHEDESCDLEHDIRVEREQNVCFHCHMPRVDSEVPHTATTNHRIAVYSATAEKAEGPEETSQESSIATLRRLRSPKSSNTEVSRSAAVAMAQWMLDKSVKGAQRTDLGEAPPDDLLELLEANRDDIAVQITVASWYRRAAEQLAQSDQSDDRLTELWSMAEQRALAVLELEPNPTDARKQALDIMLAKTFENGEFAKSAQYGIEMMRVRRNPKDGYNTGLALGRMQRFSDAERAFRESIRIDATYTAPYRSLFKLYSAVNPELAEQLRQTGMMLEAWGAGQQK